MRLEVVACIGPSCENGEIIAALWRLYQAVEEVHSGTHREPECPTCQAVAAVNAVLTRPGSCASVSLGDNDAS